MKTQDPLNKQGTPDAARVAPLAPDPDPTIGTPPVRSVRRRVVGAIGGNYFPETGSILRRLPLLILSLGLLAPLAMREPECTEYSELTQITGTVEFPSDLTSGGVDVQESYAFVYSSAIVGYGIRGSLRVVDIADPEKPDLQVSMLTQGPGTGALSVRGNIAYLADRSAGLLLVDVSDPLSPQTVGVAALGEAWDVAVQENHAYVAAATAGLLVVDVSDSTLPALVGSFPMFSSAYDVAVSGEIACVTDWTTQKLWILDVSDPTAPTAITTVATPSQPMDVVLNENYAYVADRDAGLLIIDLSTPSAATIVGNLVTEYSARFVAVRGQEVYVATKSLVPPRENLIVVSVSDPTSPSVVDVLPWDSNYPLADEKFVYSTYSSGLNLLTVGTPWQTAVVGSVELPGQANSVQAAGNYAYVYRRFFGLDVIDVTVAENPTLVDSFAIPGAPSTMRIEIADNYAYLAGGQSLEIVDISAPGAPVHVATIAAPSGAHDVAVDGDHVYLSERVFGLRVFDVTNPVAPVEVGSMGVPVRAGGLDVAPSGVHVYMVFDFSFSANEQLTVIDVVNPALPNVVGSIDVATGSNHVVTGTGHVLVTTTSNPTAYQIVDVSNPTLPSLVSQSTLGEINGLPAWNGDFLYFARQGRGMTVVDVSNIHLPASVGTLHTLDAALGVAVEGSCVFIADGFGGLLIARPQCPVASTAVSDAKGYGKAEGMIARFDRGSPNPFRDRVVLLFRLRAASSVDLAIYDISGRRVAELVHESLLGGEHARIWDGRDESGNPAAAGTYLARLAVGSHTATQKLVLLR